MCEWVWKFGFHWSYWRLECDRSDRHDVYVSFGCKSMRGSMRRRLSLHNMIFIGRFYDALAFNQDISTWDTSNVKTMHGMWVDSWKTWVFTNLGNSHRTAFWGRFANAYKFDQDISKWNTCSVTTMYSMLVSAFMRSLRLYSVLSHYLLAGFIERTPSTKTFQHGTHQVWQTWLRRKFLIADVFGEWKRGDFWH